MGDPGLSYDPEWPPGTVKLAQLLGEGRTGAEIILQPRPSDNPNDPLNWPTWQKVVNYLVASYYAMMVFTFLSVTSTTWGPLGDELNFSTELLTNTFAVGAATLAIGAPILIPFALKFGSRAMYTASSAAQVGVAIWAARTMTAADWWGVNAVQCFLGALAEVLIQMTIADVFFIHQRGTMNAIYIWIMSVGFFLSPVPAGFITTDMGWRWVWWWCAILLGVQLFLVVFGFEETKFIQAQTLEGRQASGATVLDVSDSGHRDLKEATKISAAESGVLHEANRRLSAVHINPNIPRKTYLQKLSFTTTSPGTWSSFFRHSWQPFLILGSIPGVFFCSLVCAIINSSFTVMTLVMSEYMLEAPYNFQANQIGLMSLPPFLGSTVGSIVVGPLSDWAVVKLAKRTNGIYEPEMRFWIFLPFIPFQLAGFWWFGYALNNGWSWAQVAVAFGISTFGSAGLQSLALTYTMDAYNEIIGDSITGLTFMRNAMTTVFLFAIPPWISRVGMANVFNIISAVSIVILFSAAFFIWRGKHWRFKRTKAYQYYASRQFEARPLR